MSMDSSLTHFIVFDRGAWGFGATLKEAAAARPYAKKLSASALAYRVAEGSYVRDSGHISYPKGKASPVQVDVRTGEPV